ncbi:hypothetical protein ACSFBI_18160 [Variovorax sp. RB3P1]|uniref:hypothetical protein n=1 Tax=Variovorax sp. RB3P1 TaxID=3443732 RepID=UPI003F48B1AF
MLGNKLTIDQWRFAFANAFIELADGEADEECLIEDGAVLYGSHGHEDPTTVAKREFARLSAPRAGVDSASSA